MKYLRRLLTFLVIFNLVFPLTSGAAAPRLQGVTPEERAAALLSTLSPEEKVGQVFLVTFEGPEAGPRSQIYELVTKHHIGGVVLRASNDNFKALDQTLPIALSLTRQLQLAEYNASQQALLDSLSDTPFRPAFIPLFIALSQDGDGSPYDQIIGDMANGLTPLPSPMAIGATWQPDLAQRVGAVLGDELSALGINMLFGPSLDVLDTANINGGSDLGVRTFGGNPYWVGEMGRSFITGVHQGSDNRIAVIAKHFPGYGSSDRLPDEEVATVRKSFEQLRQFDLLPFFAVTGGAPSQETSVEGLYITHTRYQGFQGNIRPNTKPLSFDPRGLSQLMELPEIAEWRSEGGIVISDDLGGQSIRRFYDSLGQNFIARFIAQEAFYAGNDLLYFDDFSSSDSSDSYTSLIRTLDFFTQRYNEDSLFAERIDQSVLRILTLKYRMYNNFSLTNTRANPNLPANIGRSEQLTLDVARNSATLVSPALNVLNETMPDPPGRNEQIVFISDNRMARQCSSCPTQSVFGVNPQEAVKALQNIVVRLYSPQAGGQVLPGNLQSYDFADLQELLDVGPGVLQIEMDLRQADWIVFLALDETTDIPSSYALDHFLEERADLYQQKNVVVFSLNSPFYLDATDISKVTAYYALYSKAPRFLDVAARLLFREIQPLGTSPVSILGVGYDVNQAVQPNPAQDIALFVDELDETSATITPTTFPTPSVVHEIGDTIPIRTAPILDHNGHRVPDGTAVRFTVTRGEGNIAQIQEAFTNNGIARATVRIEESGTIQVRADSGQARTANPLRFSTLLEPTSLFQPTATPSPTETLVPTATSTLEPTPTLAPAVEEEPLPPSTGLNEWLMALTVALAFGFGTYWVAALLGQVRWGLRGGLLSLIGGLLAYTYLAFSLPGSTSLLADAGREGVLGITLIGIGLGWGFTWGWKGLQEFSDRRV